MGGMEAHDRPLLNLPTVRAVRGAIDYGNVEVPDWLDSDPYRRKWWLHDDLRVEHERRVRELAAESEDELTAAGGFCAPASPFYDFMRPMTDAERAEMIERTRRYKRTLGYKINVVRAWWRRHWWPARIRDLEARLADDEWYG